MTQLVAIVHPLTGKVLHMHPVLAAQKHRWIHPDPCVPTPAESLPLFNLPQLDKVLSRFASTQHVHPSTHAVAALEKSGAKHD